MASRRIIPHLAHKGGATPTSRIRLLRGVAFSSNISHSGDPQKWQSMHRDCCGCSVSRTSASLSLAFQQRLYVHGTGFLES